MKKTKSKKKTVGSSEQRALKTLEDVLSLKNIGFNSLQIANRLGKPLPLVNKMFMRILPSDRKRNHIEWVSESKEAYRKARTRLAANKKN